MSTLIIGGNKSQAFMFKKFLGLEGKPIIYRNFRKEIELTKAEKLIFVGNWYKNNKKIEEFANKNKIEIYKINKI